MPKVSLELLIKKGLSRLGYQISQIPVAVWKDDARFQGAMKEILGFTLVDTTRCYMLYQFARQAMLLPGNAAEVGVYKGGTARLIGKTLAGTGKTLHLFDTFAGMPGTDAARDHHKQGDFADSSMGLVEANLVGIEKLAFHQGFFPETAKGLEAERFCFVHVDVDIHQSAAAACEFFYPRLERGGVLVFDDYGLPSCPGLKLAVDDFFARKPEKPTYLPTGQAVVLKS